MKKLTVFLLIFAMLLSLAACAGKKTEEEPQPSVQTEPAESTEEPEKKGEAAEEPAQPEQTPENEPEQPEDTAANEGEYVVLYENDGAVISCLNKLEKDENGDYVADVRIDLTNSKNSYAVKAADCTVNGFGVACSSWVCTEAGSEMDFLYAVYTSTMAEFGIESISDIRFALGIYNYDPETYETEEPAIAVTDYLEFKVGETADTELAELGEPVYDKDGIKVYSIIGESVFYSTIELFVVNETDKDVRMYPVNLEMNGELQDVSYNEYAFTVKAGGTVFDALPLPNYEINPTTYETTKIEITSLNFDFCVE